MDLTTETQEWHWQLKIMRGGASKVASKVPHLHFMVSGRDDMVAVDDLLCLLGDMAWRVWRLDWDWRLFNFPAFLIQNSQKMIEPGTILFRCKGIGTKIRKEGWAQSDAIPTTYIVLALCFLNHYTSEGTKQGPVMIYDLEILLNNTSPYLANHVEE